MYVYRAIRATDPTDSHVQTRTAAKPAGRSTLARKLPSAGNDCTRTTQPNPFMHPDTYDLPRDWGRGMLA